MSLIDELKALRPLAISGGAGVDEQDEGDLEHVVAYIARQGRVQFKAYQQVSHAIEQNIVSVQQMAEALNALREYAENERRENLRLRDHRRQLALSVAEVVDTLDDLLSLARQAGKREMVDTAERLVKRTLQIVEKVGVTEISALFVPFDEELHQSIDTAPRTGGVEPNTIVEVVRRGFQFDGKVLRKSQVIAVR